MKKFMLILSSDKKKNIDSVDYLTKIIESKGGVVNWEIMPGPLDRSPMTLPEGTDIIISLGGDGTMVRTAQRTLGQGAALIGFNRGHLGYLCDINEDNLESAIETLMQGKYHTEERMMLSGNVVREDKKEAGDFYSLNDIVITSVNGQEVIRLNILVNDTFLYAFGGDGIIISTPTGSTAYNLSASGPIVEPNTEVILLTPINPHTLNSRSIILDPADEIRVVVESRRSQKENCACVAFDGGHRQILSDGDAVTARRASTKATFIRLDESSFIERMKERLGG